MRGLLAALVLTPLFLPASGEAATLRCGTELVSDGAPIAEVLSKCGEPTTKYQRTVADTVKVRQGDGAGSSVTAEQTVYKLVEEWTYDRGPQRLVQVVVFEDGYLVDVRSGNYGRR